MNYSREQEKLSDRVGQRLHIIKKGARVVTTYIGEAIATKALHYRSFHGFSIDPNVQVIPSYTMKTKGIFSKSCIYTYRYIPTIIRTKNGI